MVDLVVVLEGVNPIVIFDVAVVVRVVVVDLIVPNGVGLVEGFVGTVVVALVVGFVASVVGFP